MSTNEKGRQSPWRRDPLTLDYEAPVAIAKTSLHRLRRWRRPAAAALATVLCIAGVVLGIKYPWVFYGSEENFKWHCALSATVPERTVAFRIVHHDAGTPYEWTEEVPKVSDAIFRDYEDQFGTFKDSAMVFVHGRSAAAGQLALVRVYLSPTCEDRLWNYPARDVKLKARIARKATRGYVIGQRSFLLVRLGGKAATIYAGQPDPADESHFTIKYEIDDKPGTIDGWLQADDTVKLQIRDGPALQAAASPATAPAGTP